MAGRKARTLAWWHWILERKAGSTGARLVELRVDLPSEELAWEDEGRGRLLHKFWEDWNAEHEVQTEEEELRGEEPEVEEERVAKWPRCWSPMEACA